MRAEAPGAQAATGALDLYQIDPVKATPSPETVVFSNDVEGTALKSAQTFRTDGRVLDWTIDVANRTAGADRDWRLRLESPLARAGRRRPGHRSSRRAGRSTQFISGHGSFLYFVRPNGEPPYLVATTRPGTKLESSTSPGGRGSGFLAFIHSALTGGRGTAAPGASRIRT